jgi:hypothetical protein
VFSSRVLWFQVNNHSFSGCFASLHRLSFAMCLVLSYVLSLYVGASSFVLILRYHFHWIVQVLDAAWHVCLRTPSDKNLTRLITFACLKLISPYMPSASSGSSVNCIPSEVLRACLIFVQFADVSNASAADAPSLVTMVRLVCAVRNGDAVSALHHARRLLLPYKQGAVDPYQCYESVHGIFMEANMASELCDLLSELLQTCSSIGCSSIGQINIKRIFEDTMSSCLVCSRFLGTGGALQLLMDHPEYNAQSQNFYQKILHRAIILRRFDVLRDSQVAQVPFLVQQFFWLHTWHRAARALMETPCQYLLNYLLDLTPSTACSRFFQNQSSGQWDILDRLRIERRSKQRVVGSSCAHVCWHCFASACYLTLGRRF